MQLTLVTGLQCGGVVGVGRRGLPSSGFLGCFLSGPGGGLGHAQGPRAHMWRGPTYLTQVAVAGT